MDTADIVLVIYINIGSKPIDEARNYINDIKRDIEKTCQKFTTFFVPIRNGDTKIECINPQLLTKKDYDTKVSKIMFEATTRLDEFIENELNKKKKKIKKIS